MDFVREHLPAPPARVLEVGCGQGEVTTALAVEGHDVLGIDPLAPHGDLFRRVRLEDLADEEAPFDGVVASHSLHHLRDLDHALDRIVALLRPRGLLLLDEMGSDLADEATFDWLYGQRRALAAAGHGEAPRSLEALREEWDERYLGVQGYRALRAGVDTRFEEQTFLWTPYLYRQLGGVATEVLEQALIDSGAIRALGFRYAGVALAS
ncbi:MAG: class I SAM-dependent methyltransferase [Gaiellaceae bacterium]